MKVLKIILKYVLITLGYILGALIFGVVYFLLILGVMWFAYSI